MLDVDVVIASLQANFSARSALAAHFSTYYDPKLKVDKKELKPGEGLYKELHREHASKVDHMIVDLPSGKIRKRLAKLEEALVDETRIPVAFSVDPCKRGDECFVTLFLNDLTVATLTVRAHPFGVVDVQFSSGLQKLTKLQGHRSLEVGSGMLGPVQVAAESCALLTGDPEQPLAVVFAKKGAMATAGKKNLEVVHVNLPEFGEAHASTWNPTRDTVACLHRQSNIISVTFVESAGTDPVPVSAVNLLDRCGIQCDDSELEISLRWSFANKGKFFVVTSHSSSHLIGIYSFTLKDTGGDTEHRIIVSPEDSFERSAPLMAFALDASDSTMTLGFGDGAIVSCLLGSKDTPATFVTSMRFIGNPIHALCWHGAADLLCVCLASRVFVVDRTITPIGLSLASAESSDVGVTNGATSEGNEPVQSVSLVDYIPRRSSVCDGGCFWLRLNKEADSQEKIHAIFVAFGRGPMVLLRVRLAHLRNRSTSFQQDPVYRISNVQVAREHIRGMTPHSASEKTEAAMALVGLILDSESESVTLTARLKQAISVILILVSRLLELQDPANLSRALLEHSVSAQYCRMVSDSGVASDALLKQFLTLLRSGLSGAIGAGNYVIAFRFAHRIADLESDEAWRIFSMLRRSAESSGEDAIASVCLRYEARHRVAEELQPGWDKTVLGAEVIAKYLDSLEERAEESGVEDFHLDDVLRLGFWLEAQGEFKRAAALYAAHGLTSQKARASRNGAMLTNN